MAGVASGMAGIPARWDPATAPAIKSRSELMQARKRARIPDMSYDFDGDGVVSSLDYFVGRSFDKDMDGKLTTTERRQAEKALDAGFLDKYARGFDAQGTVRPYALKQRCGSILTLDNTAEVSESLYPKHHNADVVPKHETRTAMHLSRTGEAKQHGFEVGEKFMAQMAPVPRPEPHNAQTHPRVCSISSLSQAVEADHQAARVRGGLLPMNTAVNPERELKTHGMSYVAAPNFQTRSQLLETRKELMKQQCEDLRSKGEDANTPRSVASARAHAHEFNFRRGNADVMTLSKLKDQRRAARRDYDMEHFRLNRNALEYPKFSDNPDMPFWLADHQESMASTAPPLRLHASVSEPVLKVNQVPFGEAPRAESLKGIQAAATAQRPQRRTDLGAKTVKRFSVEMTENGEGRNKPRLFDSIQPVEVNVRDFEPLDATSCMEPIRRKCLAEMAGKNRRNAERPMRSKMYDTGRGSNHPHGLRGSSGRNNAPGSSASADAPGASAQSGLGMQMDNNTHRAPRAPMTSAAHPGSMQTVYVGGSMDSLAPPRAYAYGAGGSSGVRSGGFQHFDRSQPLVASLGPASRTAHAQAVAPPPPALPLQH